MKWKILILMFGLMGCVSGWSVSNTWGFNMGDVRLNMGSDDSSDVVKLSTTLEFDDRNYTLDASTTQYPKSKSAMGGLIGFGLGGSLGYAIGKSSR
jgi:hypothetical protein